MKNFGQMMKQAQQMQEKMQELQEELEQESVEGQSGGGMVRITVSGRGEATALHIDRSLMNPEETEILEDLILAALHDGKTKAESLMSERMQDLTGGISLPPGFKMPF